MMLASEIRFAVPNATFALEEVALGLYPTGNATVRLPRQIPWVHAQELLLGAAPIDAEHADNCHGTQRRPRLRRQPDLRRDNDGREHNDNHCANEWRPSAAAISAGR